MIACRIIGLAMIVIAFVALNSAPSGIIEDSGIPADQAESVTQVIGAILLVGGFVANVILSAAEHVADAVKGKS